MSNSKVISKINDLKKKHQAIVLAHNYQLGEVQDAADFVGDSLDLSRRAAATEAEVIVFCGVHFMAETAAILSPTKTVLLPEIHAGCPMADMVDAPRLRKLKEEKPGAKVVCYVNSSAEVKAESDICCTSANAIKVVEQIDKEAEIIFIPDQFLGAYIQQQTGREMYLWPGFCPTHLRILPEHIAQKREQYPGAKVIAHPECDPAVSSLADAVLSTNGLCNFAKETEAETIIVGTELGIIHRLQLENPHKRFVPASEQAICPNMKMITLEKVLRSLEEMQHQITVPEEIRVKAERAVQRMIAVG